MKGRTRYTLTYTLTDMDGSKQHREQAVRSDDDPEVAYRRKLDANKYLMGGATITNVKLYRVEEVWTQIQPDPPSIYDQTT